MTDTDRALRTFDRLPDLLARASEEVGSTADPYTRQDLLRALFEERLEPYKWSMPIRHFLQCPICGAQDTEVRYELGDGVRRVKLNSEDVHEVREHSSRFPADVEAFLLSVEKQVE